MIHASVFVVGLMNTVAGVYGWWITYGKGDTTKDLMFMFTGIILIAIAACTHHDKE